MRKGRQLLVGRAWWFTLLIVASSVAVAASLVGLVSLCRREDRFALAAIVIVVHAAPFVVPLVAKMLVARFAAPRALVIGARAGNARCDACGAQVVLRVARASRCEYCRASLFGDVHCLDARAERIRVSVDRWRGTQERGWRDDELRMQRSTLRVASVVCLALLAAVVFMTAAVMAGVSI